MFLKCSRRACPCGSFLWWGEDGKIVGSKGVKLNFLREGFVYICRRKEKLWRIGHWSRVKAGWSPKGTRKRGGLDVEAVGRQVEVQKEREREVDWTLKRSEPRRKSKRSEKERRIGLWSGGEMRGSPKGARNSGGLDFEAEGRQEKVQNASRRTRAEDQT